MTQKHLEKTNSLQESVLRITRIHFFLALAYALSIIVFDSWNLIAPLVILQRWQMAAALLATTTILWCVARNKLTSSVYYKVIVFALVAVDISLATVSVYTERGVDSLAVMLFAIPIIVSATLSSRAVLYATAALCTASYVLAAVRYFVLNFGEGYKVELYGVVGFYSSVFFIIAALLCVLVVPKKV